MRRILFVCVENSCRSQMAEALCRQLAPRETEVFSAGSRPSGVVNPKAIAAMAELGYDLGRHTSQGLDSLPAGEFDFAVTMGCGDQCPMINARQRLDWQIPDPKHMDRGEFNAVRDMIAERVKQLLDTATR